MLAVVVLIDGDVPLVTLDQNLITTQAQEVEVAPGRRETFSVAARSHDPIFGSVYYGGSKGFDDAAHFPAVNYSVAGDALNYHHYRMRSLN